MQISKFEAAMWLLAVAWSAAFRLCWNSKNLPLLRWNAVLCSTEWGENVSTRSTSLPGTLSLVKQGIKATPRGGRIPLLVSKSFSPPHCVILMFSKFVIKNSSFKDSVGLSFLHTTDSTDVCQKSHIKIKPLKRRHKKKIYGADTFME